MENRVSFTRHIKDKVMPTYYRKAKFFVLPSKFEPFGMTAAEAMACGTPLISSKRSGISKYLKNKKDCLIVKASNKKDLAKSFHILNKNTIFRNKITKTGLKLARTKFSWTSIANESLSFYKKMLAGK